MTTDKQTPQGIIIQDTFNGSIYSQLVGVTVTDIDITLEFVFVNPRTEQNGKKIGKVVSRITLPRNSAEGLAQTIVNTVKQHEERKGKKNGHRSI